jgi:hypothetical protein
MADREVRVTIQGKEYVSGEAKKAEGALGSFTEKVKGMAAAAGALLAGAALGKFFKDALDEAGKAEVGMARLAAAVRNAGGDFTKLKPQIETVVASVQKMSTATDDDLREALTRMIAITGDTEGSLKNLSLVTDLAAFKQVDLETASLSVAKAMAGNTTELNRLGVAGTDATSVIKNARAAFGGFAAAEAKTFSGSLAQIKNQWGEFQEAVGKAILGSGELGSVTSGLATMLGNLAGWVEKNEAGIATFTHAVFETAGAIFSTASAIWDVLGPPLKWLAGVGVVAVIGTLNTLTLVLTRTAGVFQEFAGTALAAIGSLVEKGGKLLKVFGIDVVQSTGTSLRQFGEELRSQGTATAERAVTDYKAAMGRLGALIQGKEMSHTAAVKKGEDDRRAITRRAVDDVKADHLEMEIARQKAATATNELFGKTIDLLRKQNEALRGAESDWGKQHTIVKNYTTSLKDLLPPVEALKQEINKNNDALQRNKETAKELKGEFKETVDEAAMIGRGIIDAAQAAGVMDKEFASVLTSAINIGESLAALSVEFSAGGLVGVIGGIANVITTIGGSNAELRKALDANKAALDRLSREVGNFNLGATGKTFTGTEKAIAAAQQAIANVPGHVSAGNRGAIARQAFRRELIKQGISVEDAEQLLKDLGLGGALDSDAAFGKSLGQLEQGLKDTEFGQFGQDFENQFRATTEGFGIHGTGKEQQLQELSDLASRFSPALATALQSGDAKGALQGLFEQLKTGELDPSQFGDLNANQFLDLIKTLLGLLEEVPAPKTAPVDPPRTKGLQVPGPFTPIPPLLDPELLSPSLSPADVLGRFTGPLITGLPSFPPLGDRFGLTTKDGLAGSSYKQEVAQLVQGDLVNQFNITPRDTTDPEIIAEIVAQRLGERYALQKQALGIS